MFPNFQRAAEGILNDVFRQRQIMDPKYAGERRDQSRNGGLRTGENESQTIGCGNKFRGVSRIVA